MNKYISIILFRLLKTYNRPNSFKNRHLVSPNLFCVLIQQRKRQEERKREVQRKEVKERKGGRVL